MAKIKKKGTKNHHSATEDIRSMAHNVSEQYVARKKQVNTALLIAAVLIVVSIIYGMIKSGQEKSAGILLETAYASLSGTTGSEPNYDKALQGFQNIVKQYGNTLNGAIAQFSIGNTLVRMGKPEDALKAYQECIRRYSGEKIVAALAYQRIGYLYAGMGRQEDAMAAFKQAEAITGTGVATLELAQLLEQTGKAKEALDKYKELAEKLPSTSFAMSARSKLPPPDISATKSAPAGTINK